MGSAWLLWRPGACESGAACLPPGAKGAERAKPLQAGMGAGLGGSAPVSIALSRILLLQLVQDAFETLCDVQHLPLDDVEDLGPFGGDW